MKRIIAGYTAAPAEAVAAAAYYDVLLQVPEADGLEFAWNGAPTPAQLAPVLSRIPRAWTITLNDIPATWRASVQQPTFGLASPDESGRKAAIAMVREVHAGIRAMNDNAGRNIVLATEFHCAPGFDNRVVDGDANAFKRSLDEMSTMDWEGCSVMIEHCDAFLPGQKPAKGFLRLHDEIAVLKGLAGAPIGLSLNWGRSLIEVRDAERVMDHVVQAAGAGVLKAFTFSGTAGSDNVYGSAWADSHLPFADTTDRAFAEPASMMTTARVLAVLPYLDRCQFVAIKTNWPAKRADPLERAASVVANFYTLFDVMNHSERHSIAT